jgi:hypothetical protein
MMGGRARKLEECKLINGAKRGISKAEVVGECIIVFITTIILLRTTTHGSEGRFIYLFSIY